MRTSFRKAGFSINALQSLSPKSSHSFQQQAIEAISVSSLGWLAAISLVCGVTCTLMIPDARIKDSLQASIATLTLSGAWVISLMKGLVKEFVVTLWALIKLVLDLLSSIAELLTSSRTQWAGWFSGFKLKVFCFRPPGASHIPKSASRGELSVALLEAAASGSLRDAAALLKRGARCTVRDENLMTPLHLAASWGHYAIVKLLLSYKNKDWFAQGGITPIHLAARYGHSKVVKLLISNGGHDWINDRADSPEALQKFKFPRIISHGKTFSARELAAVYGHENAVLAFPLTKKDDILHAMSSVCALGNQSMVETIWRHHKQRSYFKRHSNPTKLVSTFQAPPLHLAVTSKNPALAAYLLERGFPVNDQATAEGSEYSSPAHYAAMTGSAEILYLLKSSGGAVTSLDFRNRTPLSYAIEHEHVQAVSFLVRQASLYRSTYSKDAVTFHLGSGHRTHVKGWNVMNDEIRAVLKQIGI